MGQENERIDMKKLLILIIVLHVALSAGSVPANPTPHVFIQPDGTQVTLRLCGDEFYHFTTTDDGYTVLQRADGAWVYARRSGVTLAPTDVLAHDVRQRTAAETALTTATPMHLTDLMAVEEAKQMRTNARQPLDEVSNGKASLPRQDGPQRATTFDVSKFRGLIILVEPADVEFSMGDRVQEFYHTLANTKNFTGFNFGDYGIWTGSVRDYYFDNSCGKFDPEFDIVGPVKVSFNATEFNDNRAQVFQMVLNKVNSQVDFTQYDGDNDGVVDMVFFLVAGYGSNYAGNDAGLLWPHMGYKLTGFKYDKKNIHKYACSTELGGPESGGYVDGIGTICHEFSHVLGLEDLYDTDYGVNGQSHHPGNWDIMASGNFLNYGRTPPGYSIYERYSLGFATPSTITSEGGYALNPLGDSNEGYILRTPVNNEFFIMENRQQTSKWDRYLPGHGMLVARVDSTNSDIWANLQINNDANHMYYELLRAGNTHTGDIASDPFPGTSGVNMLTNTTSPNLRTWNGTVSDWVMTNIVEQDDKIYFSIAIPAPTHPLVETFDSITVGATEAQGDIAMWRMAKCQIVEVAGSGHAVAMKNPSVLQMTSPVNYEVQDVLLTVNNTSSTMAKLNLLYSIDGGLSWIAAKSSAGGTTMAVEGNTHGTLSWIVGVDQDTPVLFRVTMTGGSSTAPCLIDDFTIFYLDGENSSEKFGDVNQDGSVDVEDVNAVINVILDQNEVSDYQSRADLNGDNRVDVEDLNVVVNIILGLHIGLKPDLSSNTTTLSFCSFLGEQHQMPITVTGKSLVGPVFVEVTGDEDVFKISHNQFSISEDGSVELTVTYCPDAAGEYQAQLLLTSEYANTVTVSLSGRTIEPVTVEKKTHVVNGVTFEMAVVEGGTFTMGATPEQGDEASSNEKPAHQVTLSDYAIGVTEVTQELWQAVMGENPSYFNGSNNERYGNHADYGVDLQRPVECVSWYDAQKFIAKLNELTGKIFRLPTEAEWEYAARGGRNSLSYKYSGSNNADEVAWYGYNYPGITHSVATKTPNELGLYDMSGNIIEMCQDTYGNYIDEPQVNPTGPATATESVVGRGGCPFSGAGECRVSWRSNCSREVGNLNRGLRLAQ